MELLRSFVSYTVNIKIAFGAQASIEKLEQVGWYRSSKPHCPIKTLRAFSRSTIDESFALMPCPRTRASSPCSGTTPVPARRAGSPKILKNGVAARSTRAHLPQGGQKRELSPTA